MIFLILQPSLIFNLHKIYWMKNLSLVLNVILFVLVGVLFYFHFKGSSNRSITITPSSKDSLVLKPLKVAYVDLDSIEANFGYYKQRREESERRSESIDRELNSSYNSIEKERYDFSQRGNAISQVEAENFQREYTTKMQNLQKRKEQLTQELMDQNQKILEDVQTKINGFLEEYNKTKNYSFIFTAGKGNMMLFYKDTTYNITDEVVAGLNELIKVQTK